MPQDKGPGVGMKFPPQVNKATGRFVVSSREDSIRESVYLIMMTQRTERFLRPNFGSDLLGYTFMDVNSAMVNVITRSLREQITSQEPRINNVVISTDSEVQDGCLVFEVDYTIRETGEEDNLIFPFYLNAEAEEETYEPEQYEDEVEQDPDRS